MPENVPIDVARAAIKEAVSEWLDQKFAEVGKWTLRGIAAAIFGAAATTIIHLSSK